MPEETVLEVDKDERREEDVAGVEAGDLVVCSGSVTKDEFVILSGGLITDETRDEIG